MKFKQKISSLTKENNYFYFLFITVLLLTMNSSCVRSNETVTENNIQSTPLNERKDSVIIKTNDKDSVYFTPKYFNLIRNYIIKTGKKDTIDAGAMLDEPQFLVYHRLTYQNVILTVDLSNRIFINKTEKNKFMGNIVNSENKTLSFECDDEQVKNEMYVAYTKLANEIISKQ